MKTFTDHISDRGLGSRIYKELSKHNNKKTMQEKMRELFEQTVYQRICTTGK